jgi:hypothetical protein
VAPDLLPCRRRAEGQLHRLGNFRQAEKGQHAEAFGLFTGGRDLGDAAKQTYLYFEVRQDGMYFIAHRSGANVHKLVDWTASPAIHKFGDTPNATQRPGNQGRRGLGALLRQQHAGQRRPAKWDERRRER